MTPLPTAAGGDIIHPGPRIDPEATVAPAWCFSPAPGPLPNHLQRVRWAEWAGTQSHVGSVSLVEAERRQRCWGCTIKPRKELVQSPLPLQLVLVGI